MSDEVEVQDNKGIENLLDTIDNSIKHKKPKHNSKRRRCKKTQITFDREDCNFNKVDEVVNFLCNTISKNESETSVDTNPPVKIAKESPKRVGFFISPSQSKKSDCVKQLPTTSSEGLSDLFQNLKVHSSNNSLNSNELNELLFNSDLLKKTNCGSIRGSTESLENLKREKLKTGNKKDLADKANGKLKEYVSSNASSISEKTLLTPVEPCSISLASDLDQSCNLSLPETEESPKKNKSLKNSNVDQLKGKDDLNRPKKSINKIKVGFSKVNEIEKPPSKIDYAARIKNSRKKKNKPRKDVPAETGDETEMFDGNQKVFLNSGFHCKKDLNETKILTSQLGKNRKRQHSVNKRSATGLKNDMKFPKYLSQEELQNISNFGVLLSGIIRINQKNYKEAYITAPDKGMDILIEGLRDRNRALEGDDVYFVLKPKEHHRTVVDSTDIQRTAVVVGIKAFNHNRGAIGTLNVIKNKNINFAVFSPRDSRLPRIRIRRNNWPMGFSENSAHFKDKLYFAKIYQWNDTRYADGEIIKEVGMVGDIEAETSALLLKYDLDTTPYSDSLKLYIPPETFKITEAEIGMREDFRNECIFTIDPEKACDLDDAVSCKLLPNGNYQVGVHISDVSYFLRPGTPLDSAVSKRATTVYLVQRAYHMLPSELTRLCSLAPGLDKLSFSVIWEITPDYRIINRRFTRSVINSCAQFSYNQIQCILKGEDKITFPKIYGGHCLSTIKQTVLSLHSMASFLRSKRFGNGALRIEQKSISFTLDEKGFPVSYSVQVHEEAHQLIEEFMLLANITVAEKLYEAFPKIAFLRSHAPPLTYILEKLQKSLEKYGVLLDISSSGSLHTSLSRYAGTDNDSIARMLVLNNVLAKPMARAKYYCSSIYPDEADRRHYALNVALYTHFTSPIRRYADVMTHRLLAASIGYIETPNWTPDYVQSVASNCNKQKYAAKMAGETSTELFLSVYIGLKGCVECEAVVSDIKDKSFDCIVLPTGAHQRIYFEHIKGQLSQERDGVLRLKIVWPKDDDHLEESIQLLEMFTIIKIELKRVNVMKIEANLLRTD